MHQPLPGYNKTVSKTLAAVLVAIIFFSGIAATSAAFQTSGPHKTISGETWSVDTGNITNLTYSHLENVYYDDTVTVHDGDGNLAIEGVDYQWFESNGTIKDLPGGQLEDGGQNAQITYGWNEVTTTSQSFAALFGNSYQVLLPVVFVLVLAGILYAVRELTGVGV